MDNMQVQKKSSMGPIIIIVVIALIAIIAFSGKKDEAMIKDEVGQEAMMEDKDDTSMTKDGEDEAMMKKDESSATVKGSYETYSPEKLALAKEGKVIIFFKASWCPTCRAVDANIKANLSAIPEGTHILEVDYDKSSELKKKYGVTIQHTFVQVGEDGSQVAKWIGSPTLADVLGKIK